MIAGLDVPKIADDVLDAVTTFVDHLPIRDWILLAVAVGLVIYVWVRAAAKTRQGTVEVADPAADAAGVQAKTFKADLAESLGVRGGLPASIVPSGTPTAKSLSEVIAAVPGAESKFVSALVAALPVPPTSTTFKVTTTLTESDVDPKSKCVVAYELACQGPVASVESDRVAAATWSEAATEAGKKIYVALQKQAPDIYPQWVRWKTVEALTHYRCGLLIEQQVEKDAGTTADRERLMAAYDEYDRAARLDEKNLLAPLRAATCLESLIGESVNGSQEQIDHVDAARAYLAVRLRERSIFEPGFRLSILLSNIARWEKGVLDASRDRIEATLADLLSNQEDEERYFGSRVRASWHRLLASMRPVLQFPEPPVELGRRLERAARREGLVARRRLRAYWTIVHDHRFRHRFEPAGRERRQLRHALLISRMCLGARKQDTGARVLARGWLKGKLLVAWAWLYWRHLFGRRRQIGWQAHYNAACFYSLLAQFYEHFNDWLCRSAIKHLAVALDQADGELSKTYARDVDRDLQFLRDTTAAPFYRLLPKHGTGLVVRLVDISHTIPWNLHVWGEAIQPPSGRDWHDPLEPEVTDGVAVYHVPIADHFKSVGLEAHRNNGAERIHWVDKGHLIPSRFPTGVFVWPPSPGDVGYGASRPRP